MRILPPMPLHEGYEPSSVELNQEEAILDISHPAECDLQEETKIVPETIILRCSLHPIPIRDKTIKVQLISEGEVLDGARLYNEESVAFGYEREVKNSQWQGVALEYTGLGRALHQGQYMDICDNILSCGQMEVKTPLYLKPFQTESQNHLVRTTTLPSGQVLTSPPGAIDTQALRGYGGYYKEGIVLNEIQQIYYGLTSTQQQTRVKLYSSFTLQELGSPPPIGGKGFNQNVIFDPPPREEEYLSLPGAIAAGYAHISILTEWGTVSFSSFLCESVPGHLSLVNVYFKP